MEGATVCREGVQAGNLSVAVGEHVSKKPSYKLLRQNKFELPLAFSLVGLQIVASTPTKPIEHNVAQWNEKAGSWED